MRAQDDAKATIAAGNGARADGGGDSSWGDTTSL